MAKSAKKISNSLIPPKTRRTPRARKDHCIHEGALNCVTRLLQLDPERLGKVESVHIIIESVKALMNCESVQILERIGGKPPSIELLKHYPESRQPDRVVVDGGVNHYCISNRRFFFAEEIDHENRVARGISGSVVDSSDVTRLELKYLMMKPDRDEESVLFYPLIKHNNAIGTIKLCYFDERKKFDPVHMDFFRPVAESIANLLHLYAIIERINKQNWQYDTLIAEANEALEKLQIGEKLTYQFLTATSHLHELAGILGGMNSDREEFLATLHLSSVSRKVKEDLIGIIDRYTQHRDEAHKKVRELLQGRPTKETIFLRPNNIKNLINEQLDVYDDQLERSNIRTRKSLKEADASFNVDASAFKYVIRILMNNAIRALEEGRNRPKMLEIRATMIASALAIRVIDNGVGIDREHQPKIFDAFFTTRSDGSGIGLYWAKKTIEDDHGGKLSLERSLINEGTTLLITLPLEK